MNEAQANAVAKGLRGATWQSGGGIWLVTFHRADGKIVVMSDEVVKQYDDQMAFDDDRADVTVVLH